MLLVVLVALPLVAAAVILAVSAARQRKDGKTTHRFQADTAAVQDATPPPAATTERIVSGREHRAAEADDPQADLPPAR